nr:MAG TPA: hypothetical protein [Caudoviricetes sp.]
MGYIGEISRTQCYFSITMTNIRLKFIYPRI